MNRTNKFGTSAVHNSPDANRPGSPIRITTSNLTKTNNKVNSPNTHPATHSDPIHHTKIQKEALSLSNHRAVYTHVIEEETMNSSSTFTLGLANLSKKIQKRIKIMDLIDRTKNSSKVSIDDLMNYNYTRDASTMNSVNLAAPAPPLPPSVQVNSSPSFQQQLLDKPSSSNSKLQYTMIFGNSDSDAGSSSSNAGGGGGYTDGYRKYDHQYPNGRFRLKPLGYKQIKK